jgi:peptidoglycan hydrolase-like protein with peptidoglycan-binding domain
MYMHGGLQGAAVETILSVQKALQAKGFNPGKLDGIMGANTKAAIVAFQKANGLSADGVVGPLTSAKLFPPAGPSPTALASVMGTMIDKAAAVTPLLSPTGAVVSAVKSITSAGADALVRAAANMKPDAPIPALQTQDSNATPAAPYAPPPVFVPIADVTPAPAASDFLIPALAGVALLFLMRKK